MCRCRGRRNILIDQGRSATVNGLLLKSSRRFLRWNSVINRILQGRHRTVCTQRRIFIVRHRQHSKSGRCHRTQRNGTLSRWRRWIPSTKSFLHLTVRVGGKRGGLNDEIRCRFLWKQRVVRREGEGRVPNDRVSNVRLVTRIAARRVQLNLFSTDDDRRCRIIVQNRIIDITRRKINRIRFSIRLEKRERTNCCVDLDQTCQSTHPRFRFSTEFIDPGGGGG